MNRENRQQLTTAETKHLCKNCHTSVIQNYCPNCGQPAHLERINGHYIIHEIEHVLHFEKGILYTIRELLLRPGANIRQFLSENRSRLVKPILFIIITSLAYTLVTHFFHLEESHDGSEAVKKTATAWLSAWVRDHYGYSNILMGILIAGWLRLFFWKAPFNFFEILILLCFVMGMGMLLYTVFALVQGLTSIPLMTAAGFVAILYCAWAIGQFFGARKAGSYAKALVAYLAGMVSFSVLIRGMGWMVDWGVA